MNPREYQQLRHYRERWVSDDPRTRVITLLDSVAALFSAYEAQTLSEDGWDALYFTTDVLELLESAALRGGSLEIPNRLLENTQRSVDELNGLNPVDLLLELSDGDGMFHTSSVTAFRFLHEELTATQNGGQDQ